MAGVCGLKDDQGQQTAHATMDGVHDASEENDATYVENDVLDDARTAVMMKTRPTLTTMEQAAPNENAVSP